MNQQRLLQGHGTDGLKRRLLSCLRGRHAFDGGRQLDFRSAEDRRSRRLFFIDPVQAADGESPADGRWAGLSLGGPVVHVVGQPCLRAQVAGKLRQGGRPREAPRGQRIEGGQPDLSRYRGARGPYSPPSVRKLEAAGYKGFYVAEDIEGFQRRRSRPGIAGVLELAGETVMPGTVPMRSGLVRARWGRAVSFPPRRSRGRRPAHSVSAAT